MKQVRRPTITEIADFSYAIGFIAFNEEYSGRNAQDVAIEFALHASSYWRRPWTKVISRLLMRFGLVYSEMGCKCQLCRPGWSAKSIIASLPTSFELDDFLYKWGVLTSLKNVIKDSS